MKLRPLNDWAVIRPSEANEMTAGGLYIPDSAKEKPREGVVEAIGPGAYEEEKYSKKKVQKKDRRFIATTVKPGELVIYEQYAGQTYKIGEEELILVRERDILCILSDRKPKPLQIPDRTSSAASAAIVAQKGGAAKAKKTMTKKTGKKK
jgi:chaperonin GroES